MFLHNPKMMYTVRVDQPNPAFAKMLLEQFGGPNGELAAAMRYFTQGWNEPNGPRRSMLLDIATEELSHLEMVAQTLSMLLTHLDLLEPHVPARNEPLRDGLRRVAELARRTLDETRALSHDLRPTILDDAGLVAALHWLAADYRSTFHIDVRVDAIEPPYPLSPQVEVALFRVSQEGMMNSCKHSEAQKVRLTLTPCPDSVRLLIEDDGRGFDLARIPPPSRSGRLGLSGMRERVELLGGKLIVSGRPLGGTRLDVTIPVEPRARE